MLPAAFLAPVLHEWVKALTSTLLGDPTPRNHGYLSPNPLKYFEPIGFMFVLLFGFGWGRPVPTGALHYKNRKVGVVITYTVPVVFSLLLGVASLIGASILTARVYGPVMDINMFFLLVNFPLWEPNLHLAGIILLSHFALININLAIFNLLPVYPLAANKILLLFSGPDAIAKLNHYEKPLQVILILGLAFGLAERVLMPIALRIVGLVLGAVI